MKFVLEEKIKIWKDKRTVCDLFAKNLFLTFTEVKQNEDFLGYWQKCLDVLTQGLWPIYYFQNSKNKKPE